MRLSCNGCRVLRKGCSDDCTIKLCLQWIKNPQAQQNATVFLAKFYGRAGLMNLLDNCAEPLRPAVFRSLLYETCGRIVNPIYGSAGLLWTGNWHLCQDAVEAVMQGQPITPIITEGDDNSNSPPVNVYDIRHVTKVAKPVAANVVKRFKTRPRSKRFLKARAPAAAANESGSGGSSKSHLTEAAEAENVESKERDTGVSVEAAEPDQEGEVTGVGLELTLGLKPVTLASDSHVVPMKKRRIEARVSGGDGGA